MKGLVPVAMKVLVLEKGRQCGYWQDGVLLIYRGYEFQESLLYHCMTNLTFLDS